MDFNQLNIFIYVYKTRSFSVAAKSLYLTQPTVSAHISKLENELNTMLFNRTTKQVVPTSDGEKLYRYATELMVHRDRIIDDFITKKNEHKVLSFGSSHLPTKYILPVFMTSFKRINQYVKFNQMVANSSELLEELIKGSLSFAFVSKKVDNENIEYIPYYSDRIVFITPNNEYYKKIIVGKAPITNLLKEPIILREDKDIMSLKNSTTFLQELGFSTKNLNIYGYMNDQEEIYNTVASNNVISLFSKVAAQSYKQQGKILVYNPVSNPIRRHLYIAISKINQPNEIEKSFIDFIRQNV